MSILMRAFNQWLNRPADEKFSSLEALHAAVAGLHKISQESVGVVLNKLAVITSGDATPEPMLRSQSGKTARFTHWSFGQFCRAIGAPAAYMRELPADLVATNLNYGLATVEGRRPEEDKSMKLLFSRNGDLRLRALTGNAYGRIWNVDITSRLLRFVEQNPNWQPAPAAFDGSRGLYAGDKDIFAFLVDNERRIFETLPGGGLSRGFFVSNSEVGDASFRLTTFLYEYVCGNHRVIGASNVRDLRIPHIGAADERAFREMAVELRKYADSSVAEDELKIEAARKFVIGGTKDEVLDRIFGLRIPNLPRVTVDAGYDRAVEQEDRYGDPNTAWGLAGGITELARDLPNADDRVDLERAAGRVMQMAF